MDNNIIPGDIVQINPNLELKPSISKKQKFCIKSINQLGNLNVVWFDDNGIAMEALLLPEQIIKITPSK